MLLHLLLTSDIAPSMPATCKIVHDFGMLTVRFGNDDFRNGKHCVVQDTEENIITWLKPFDGFIKGNGTPMSEQFTIAHIR